LLNHILDISSTNVDQVRQIVELLKTADTESSQNLLKSKSSIFSIDAGSQQEASFNLKGIHSVFIFKLTYK
jgi:hypothetical protein